MVFLRSARPGPRHWLRLGARAWVLAILLLGTLVSPLGQLNSHGLAEVAKVQHGGDTVHGHSHEDDEPTGWSAKADVGHGHHHIADHSHDKSHALPQAIIAAALTMPVWHPLAHPLVCGRTIGRIDRPPMA